MLIVEFVSLKKEKKKSSFLVVCFVVV